MRISRCQNRAVVTPAPASASSYGEQFDPRGKLALAVSSRLGELMSVSDETSRQTSSLEKAAMSHDAAFAFGGRLPKDQLWDTGYF